LEFKKITNNDKYNNDSLSSSRSVLRDSYNFNATLKHLNFSKNENKNDIL